MKPLKQRIINLDNRDYHMHSSSFSDGIPTINEIVQFAGTIGLTEIAITDHSQASIEVLKRDFQIPGGSTAFYSLSTWQNVYNDVKVIFGVEGDILNEDGEVCFDIQGIEPEFIILSAHRDTFIGNPETITEATINAIKKYHKKIKFIAHPCNNNDFGKYYDIEKLVKVANEYNVPLEFNAQKLYDKKANLEKLDYLLRNANKIYLNSDSHSLFYLKTVRKKAIEFLYKKGYL